ncbi:RnfH family protein [Janthinobacterium sp. 17J80-10]|uniref:RnfH family protein n=1 Tax=Janthinobacterium sp. 17J80-10 TaxID=2497863 RepID=UPI0010057077|nr:RnfH family protein [Janthinobacterium sp. 17J80-10]QAU34609.1 RnfH family protein [Janthinobacterium sp. 17J80-10]
MSDCAGKLHVQVCYARPDDILLEDVWVAPGTTLEQAVHASTLLARAPEIDFISCKVGIYGKPKPRDTVLQQRDRIEIYRPLVADPMEARRRRVAKKEKAR